MKLSLKSLLACLVFFLACGALAPAYSDETYDIIEGDTLWKLARRFYGNPSLYVALATFNKISDPNLIIAGQSITIPSDPSVLQKIKDNPANAAQIISDYESGENTENTPETPPGGPVNMDALSVLTLPVQLPSNLRKKP